MSLEEGTDTITSIAVDASSLLVGCADGWTRHYDLRQGAMSIDCLNEAVTSVAISRDAASHLVSVADATVKLLDKTSGELLATYKGHSEERFKDYKIEVLNKLFTVKKLSFILMQNIKIPGGIRL